MRPAFLRAMGFAAAAVLAAAACGDGFASPAPSIQVSGRHLVDARGNAVRLRGVMNSLHPFFCGGIWGWGRGDADAERCIAYFDSICRGLADRKQGMYANMIRLTDDGHWSWNDALKPSKDAPGFMACDHDQYRRYVDRVLTPVVSNAVSRGLYVIIRPSFLPPHGDVAVRSDYHRHLLYEWDVMSSCRFFKKHAGRILFELQNEPVGLTLADGKKDDSALAKYFQPVVDVIRRNGFKGVILAPGLGYQSEFRPFVRHPLRDANLGYAVHVYCGWYGQDENNADVDVFVANFLSQVPVVLSAPCVVTEVDWSPEKPGAGKKNEFGQYVPANWGTWATASTARWGKAYLGMIERFGNVSTIANTLFDSGHYHKTGELKIVFDGNPEASARAMTDLYLRWARQEPVRPETLDRHCPRKLTGEEIDLKTVRHLTIVPFRMVCEGSELRVGTERQGDWNVGYGAVQHVARAEKSVHLFKAIPRVHDGKECHSLRVLDNRGLMHRSALGDSVAMAKGYAGYVEGSGANADALWNVEAVEGGFTFRNVETGKYLGPKSSPHSDRPAVWKCTTRIVRPAKKRRK